MLYFGQFNSIKVSEPGSLHAAMFIKNTVAVGTQFYSKSILLTKVQYTFFFLAYYGINPL